MNLTSESEKSWLKHYQIVLNLVIKRELTENLSTYPVLERRVMQYVVTISAVVPITGSGLNWVIGAIVPVTMPLVPALVISQYPATILFLLVVAGQNYFRSID